MNGWLIFFIIALVLGFIASNLLLLKQSAKFKVPEKILKEIAERKRVEALNKNKKKPNSE